MKKVVVYGLVLGDEQIAYVGVTSNLLWRLKQHRYCGPCRHWWKEWGARIKPWVFAEYTDRKEALKREAQLIKLCRPVFNTRIAENPGTWERPEPGKKRRLGDRWASWQG